jgi:hypothetical protein
MTAAFNGLADGPQRDIWCPFYSAGGRNMFDNYLLLFRWLYRRTIAVDGNMSAQHMKMRRPELDVSLTDGNGYVVEDSPYREHLGEAVEIKQVCYLIYQWLVDAIDSVKEIHMQEPQGL